MSSNLENNELDQINQDLYETYCSTCKDLFKQNFADGGFVEPLRRLILIGKLKYANSKEVKTQHDQMIKDIQEDIMDDSSKVSGLMVVYKSFFYHVVEGSDEALIDVIESTSKLVQMRLLIGVKVIRSSTISFRFFIHWNSCVILSPEYVDPVIEEAAERQESDVSTLISKIKKFEGVVFVIASYVRYLKQEEVEESINELVPTSVLPFKWEMEELDQESFFLTVEKHLETYLASHDYTSYIEQEWPPTGPADDSKDYFDVLETFEKRIDDSLKMEEEQKKKKARYGSWWWST